MNEGTHLLGQLLDQARFSHPARLQDSNNTAVVYVLFIITLVPIYRSRKVLEGVTPIWLKPGGIEGVRTERTSGMRDMLAFIHQRHE